MKPEQRVRVAIIRIEAMENGRPVALPRLLRELPDMSRDAVEDALARLRGASLVHNGGDGWISRPPPRRTE